MIRCNTCGWTGPPEFFDKDKRKKSGRRLRCKKCHKKYNQGYNLVHAVELRRKRKIHYQNNKGRLLREKLNNIKRVLGEWKKYFTKRYGENPGCECCGAILGWFTGTASKSVHLDHRHDGTEEIKRPPAEWLQNRACTAENIKIIESCNFGVICRKCNNLLPTQNRLKRLRELIRYAKNTKKVKPYDPL